MTIAAFMKAPIAEADHSTNAFGSVVARSQGRWRQAADRGRSLMEINSDTNWPTGSTGSILKPTLGLCSQLPPIRSSVVSPLHRVFHARHSGYSSNKTRNIVFYDLPITTNVR